MTEGTGEVIQPREPHEQIDVALVRAVFDTVGAGLRQEFEQLVVNRPELMTPNDVQLEHARALAKNVGGQEVLRALQEQLFPE